MLTSPFSKTGVRSSRFDRPVSTGCPDSLHTRLTGGVGDSYDNALAETIIGLYKTEVIRKRAPWKTLDEVEYATLEWVDWFNHRRLLAPIGNVPPADSMNRCTMMKLTGHAERHDSMYGLLLFLNSS